MKQYNRKIEILRAFAIFSVVCAHTAVVSENAPTSSVIAKNIMSHIGIIGVPIFFFLAGYFHSLSVDDFRKFIKKKLIQIVLPTVFCFTVLWLYVAIRKGGLDFSTWLSFVSGTRSTAYYVVCLLVLYMLSFPFRKNKSFIVICITISAAWFLVSKFSFAVKINEAFLSTYHNVFYWLGYFCLGMAIGISNSMDKMFYIAKKYGIWFLAISLAVSGLLYYFKRTPTYFEVFSFALTLVWSFAVIGIASLDIYKQGGIIEHVGNYSFTIFLIHQLFTGLIIHISEKADCFFTVSLRPIVNIAVVLALVYMYRFMNKLFDYRLNFVRFLVGIREKK